ncbi:hypothetical protein [Halobacterium yunchengense]|uniref:hypothetical protein n=1 Tax=Halobacterium yunchengense TaxID=3108497 RepID=UPI00300893E2
MDAKRAAVHSAKYFLATTLFALIALGFVAAGAYLSRPALEAETTSALLTALAPGVALAVVGVAVYRFGQSWALYKTLTAAHEEALADTFDTQRVKSDIVSLVDDRLSDMQTELQSANRELRKLREDEPYDFSQSASSASTGRSTSGTGSRSTSDTGSGSTSGTGSGSTTTGAADESSDGFQSSDGFEPASPDADRSDGDR